MDTNAMRDTLSQTVASLDAWGVILLGVVVIVFFGLLLPKKPDLPEPQNLLQEIEHANDHIMYYAVVLAALIIGLLIIGEAFGIDTLQGVTPR